MTQEFLRVHDVMRDRVRTVTPDTRFGDVARNFLRSSDRGLWIAAAHGPLLGVIRLVDVQPFLKDADLVQTVIAADIATEDVPRLAPTMNLPMALNEFTRTKSEILPVVDPETGRALGSIGRADLLLAISELARREGTRDGD